ncbi:MAG: hypothetical protein ACRDOU_18010 [Streptosporangiaceae bacterium]
MRCSDGACGWVSRVVVDPAAALTVTHLVVVPEDRHEPGRLVPLDLVHTAAGALGLRCTTADAGIQLNITRRQVRHLPRYTGPPALG